MVGNDLIRKARSILAGKDLINSRNKIIDNILKQAFGKRTRGDVAAKYVMDHQLHKINGIYLIVKPSIIFGLSSYQIIGRFPEIIINETEKFPSSWGDRVINLETCQEEPYDEVLSRIYSESTREEVENDGSFIEVFPNFLVGAKKYAALYKAYFEGIEPRIKVVNEVVPYTEKTRKDWVDSSF